MTSTFHWPCCTKPAIETYTCRKVIGLQEEPSMTQCNKHSCKSRKTVGMSSACAWRYLGNHFFSSGCTSPPVLVKEIHRRDNLRVSQEGTRRG